MKRLLIGAILTVILLSADACEPSDCTQCGFAPGEHILTTYTDSSGTTIYVSGYADGNGCFTAVNCP